MRNNEVNYGMTMFVINGLKIYASLWSEERKTNNNEVCVKGNTKYKG